MFFNLYFNVWIGFDLALKIWLTFLDCAVTNSFRNATRMSSGKRSSFGRIRSSLRCAWGWLEMGSRALETSLLPPCFVSVCLHLFRQLYIYKKIPRTMRLKQSTFISNSSQSWGVQDQIPCLVRACFLIDVRV